MTKDLRKSSKKKKNYMKNFLKREIQKTELRTNHTKILLKT